MKNKIVKIFSFFFIFVFSITFLSSCNKKQKPTIEELKQPTTKDFPLFNSLLLSQLQKFYGGGYCTQSKPLYKTFKQEDGSYKQNAEFATKKSAFRGLQDAFIIDENAKTKPIIDSSQAFPSFCSSACYIALLSALNEYDKEYNALSYEAWLNLAPGNISKKHTTNINVLKNTYNNDFLYDGLDDGIGVWGRANANSIGIACLIKDLDCGINFFDINKSLAGDFLKIFWKKSTGETRVGTNENGHQVVYLGQSDDYIIIWSSNNINGEEKGCFDHGTDSIVDNKDLKNYWPNGGYGIEYVKKEKIGGMVFSRITNPNNFEMASKIGFDNANEFLVNCSLPKSNKDCFDKRWEDAQDYIRKYGNVS